MTKLQSTEVLMQNAVAATANGTVLNVDGFGPMAFQVTGTFVGTVTFEASLDGSNYVSIVVYDLPTNTAATTATAPNIFYSNVHALHHVRARVSAYTSGNITVLARAVAA